MTTAKIIDFPVHLPMSYALINEFGTRAMPCSVESAEKAEKDILEHRVVRIPAKDWDRFWSWAESPAREIPALKELIGRPPTWRK